VKKEYAFEVGYTITCHAVNALCCAYTVFRKKSNIFIFTIYFSQFLGKFYETFSEYTSVNMSTDSNLILTESVKYSLCSDIIMTFL